MKFILHLAVWPLVVLSCTTPEPADLSGCYQMIIRTDTATLSINQDGQRVTGSLAYNWTERDDNTGTFNGAVRNDSLIVADYTFQSEGITSVRQVIFKVRDSMLLQGYGEVVMKNDTAFLRDVNLAVFDTKHPFRKGCK